MNAREQVGTGLLLLLGGRSGSEQVGAVVAEVDVDVMVVAGIEVEVESVVVMRRVRRVHGAGAWFGRKSGRV